MGWRNAHAPKIKDNPLRACKRCMQFVAVYHDTINFENLDAKCPRCGLTKRQIRNAGGDYLKGVR